MNEKHILLADSDAFAAEELRSALGAGWVVKSLDTGAAVLSELKANAYQALMVSLRVSDMTPAHLLNRVRSKYPQVVRFVIATERDRQRVIKEALGAHQFLVRPFEPENLRATIEGALASDHWMHNETLRKLVTRMRMLPSIPAMYFEIVSALRSATTTTEDVGALISQDMEITTKLLQMINSAYFGLPRTVTSPAEAVGLLGFETAKSMVMAVKLLTQYDRIKTGDFSIDALWLHSTAVAHGARKLVMAHTGDRGLADEAFAAGLLHDVGKAVLAGNFGEQYAGAESLARKQHLELFQVEREIFGANHGEVGAYLLSLWGLPRNTLEAAALHHEPARSTSQTFTVLTAVHVADALYHFQQAEPAEGHARGLDKSYLEQIGVLKYLPAWCEELLGPELAAAYIKLDEPQDPEESPQADAGTPVSTVNAAEIPAEVSAQILESTDLTDKIEVAADEDGQIAAEAKTEPDAEVAPYGQPSQSSSHRRALPRNRSLVAGSVSAVLLVIVIFALVVNTPGPAPVNVQAHTAQPAIATSAKPSVSDETASKPDREEVGAQVETEPEWVPELGNSGYGPTNASAVPVQQSSTAPKEEYPKLKLQGIFFSTQRPSAMINGTLMRKGELVEGARVVDIKRDSVTFEFRGVRRTLTLE